MDTLSPTEEKVLVEATKTAVDYVDNDGMTPDEAIIKVAREEALLPGAVRSIVNAYNNGRQVAQWNDSQNLLDKLASFELADYEKIHDEIWGGSVKEAQDAYAIPNEVHPEYGQGPELWLRRPQQEKLAGMDLLTLTGERQDTVVDHEIESMIHKHAADKEARKTYHAHIMTKRAFDEARAQHSQANDVLNVRIRLLENYFKKLAMDRVPFHVADDVAGTYFGAQGRALFDHLASKFPNEKRAADMRIFHEKPVCMECPPFTFISGAIQAARAVNQTKEALDTAQEALDKAGEDLRPFVRGGSSANPPPPESTCLISGKPLTKEGGMGMFAAGSAVATGTRHLLDSALGSGGKNKAIEDAQLELEDPEHENELRKIRVQAMLNSMMSDPENPVSGHDPEEVLNAYNEIARLAPRLAEQQVAVQPLLAKHLAGNVEPFEVKEIADTEKAVKESRQPPSFNTNLMPNGPKPVFS